jgi:hypothetical protein
LKTFDKQKLTDLVYSQVTPKSDLNLADLSATALKQARRTGDELIGTRDGQIPGDADMGRGRPRRVP